MRIAVAVSGGADSIALMVHAAQKFPSSTITALSVDHGTRVASNDERNYAAKIASRLGISFQTLAPSMPGYGHAHWRKVRLRTLADFCVRGGINLLWLGHHGDDAVETAAIRLLADGPLHGLAGISAVGEIDGIRIERPLLKLSSRAIRRQLIANGLGWIEDPSNRNLAYKRSAVRRTLSVMSDAATHPQSLVQRSARWRVDMEKLERDAWALAATATPYATIRLKCPAFDTLPTSLQARLLQRAALAVTGRPDRIRQVDFMKLATNMQAGPFGGALLLEEAGEWCVSRNPASCEAAIPLSNDTVWDQCFRVYLTEPPPAGEWRVAPVNAYRVGAMSRLAPEPVLDCLPAILGRDGIVAIPHLGIWRGHTGPYWAEHLTISWLGAATKSKFELVC